jgi:hypothetical protein
MKTDPATYGVLERWWALWWGTIRANFYCLFHWDCHVYLEYRMEERSSPERDLHGERIWDEVMTYIAVVKGHSINGDMRVVKSYYGRPRLPLLRDKHGS